MCISRIGEYEDCFYASQLPVGGGNVAFVFKVFDASYATEDKLGLFAFCQVNGKVVVCDYPYSGFVVVECFDVFHTLSHGIGPLLVDICTHGNDDFVKEGQCPCDDVGMSDGEGVERAGKKSDTQKVLWFCRSVAAFRHSAERVRCRSVSGGVLCGVIFHEVFLHHKVVDDEVLTFHGVLSHIVCQQVGHLVRFV